MLFCEKQWYINRLFFACEFKLVCKEFLFNGNLSHAVTLTNTPVDVGRS